MGVLDFLRRDVKEAVGLKNKKAMAKFTEKEEVEVTINDVPKKIKDAIIDEYLTGFDLTPLFPPHDAPSMVQSVLPWIQIGVIAVVLIKVW